MPVSADHSSSTRRETGYWSTVDAWGFSAGTQEIPPVCGRDLQVPLVTGD